MLDSANIVFSFFFPFSFPAPDPITRQCPNLGRYEIVSVLHNHNSDKAEDILGVDGEPMANAAEVQDVRVTSTPNPGRCRYGSVRRLDIGCKTPDRMEFATSCSDETPAGKRTLKNNTNFLSTSYQFQVSHETFIDFDST